MSKKSHCKLELGQRIAKSVRITPVDRDIKFCMLFQLSSFDGPNTIAARWS